jgi:environmental stress-induced protein Ves
LTPAIIRYADQPDSPWANGGGSIRLMWQCPAGERRISIASLQRPAAFSALPAMARLLMVLDPIRITLRISGQDVQLAQHETLAFSGAEPAELLDLSQPGRVLNLMALAGGWRPQLSTGRDPLGWVALGEVEHAGTLLHSGDLAWGAAPVGHAIAIHFRPA